MNKEQKDLVWTCLPKEARDKIKGAYDELSRLTRKEQYELGCLHTYENLFHYHNLTSDTEPEEMLMVLRKDVQRVYAEFPLRNTIAPGQAVKLSLNILFGDKCLPDKECPKNDTESVQNLGHSEQPSVQVEPKYKVGDKVYQTVGHNRLDEYTVKKVYTDKKRGIVYDIQGLIGIIGVEENKLCLSCQNPYTEPETTRKNTQSLSLSDKQGDETKDDTEEKKLNLTELLKGCDGEKFFSLHSGDVVYQGINGDGTLLFVKANIDVYTCVTPEGFGAYGNAGICLIFPSRALYEKYPLDARAAWKEWAEAREPKYELSGCIYIYKDGEIVDEIDLPDMNFNSLELAQQAAEGIREYLKAFHEKCTQQ